MNSFTEYEVREILGNNISGLREKFPGLIDRCISVNFTCAPKINDKNKSIPNKTGSELLVCTKMMTDQLMI